MTVPRGLTGSIPPARFRSPARGAGAILRERVSEAIEIGLADRSFSVVSAPSGYGKTTAVADWATTQSSLSWLLLNPLDSDPSHLRRGVLEALGRGYRRLGRELPSLDERTDRYVYAALRDAIADTGIDMQLVVDDAHHAGEDWRHGLLGMLADEPPERLRLVLVGTTLLDVTLSRERLLEPSLFVGADELRFTEEEIEHLAREAGQAVDSTAVLRETHGWPIAVRMVMIGGNEPTSVATTATTFLGDYVRDHVLAALDPELAAFVLATTICKEVTADLAAAITGSPDAAELLDRCVRLGLFVDRFSTPSGVVFRWHGAFVRTCADIRRSDPDGTATRHRAAAAFLSSTEPLKSIEHSLRGRDVDTARETLMSRWVTLLMNGNGNEVETAASTLLRESPGDTDLQFVLACATDVIGDHHLASEMMKRAEKSADGGAIHSTTADIARLFVCDDPGKVCGAVTRLRQMTAMAAYSGSEHYAAVNILLGWAELRNPTNPALPAEYFASAARESEEDSDPSNRQRALGHLAFGLTWAGRFTDASETLAGIKASGWPSVASHHNYAGASAKAAAGYVAYWAGDSAACVKEFTDVLNTSRHDPSFTAVARMMIAYAVAEGADTSASRRAAIGIQEIPIETLHGVPWQVFRESSIAMLEEASGNLGRAARIARKYVQCPTLPVVVVALAGILRRAGEYGEALQMLRSLHLFSEVSYVKTATLVTAAVIRRHAGDHSLAHELCEAALVIAAKENVRLPFAPRETAARKLLSEHIHAGSQFEDFIGACLASDVAGSQIDALSDRERDVFRQLQTSRTLPEIAEVLGLSINTVKTHQRSIYRKLGVASRRDAVHTTV